MAEWFLGCDIQLDVPVEDNGESFFTTIAHYPSDPGFQVGDTIQIVDAALVKTRRSGQRTRDPELPRFTFEGLVKERLKIVNIDNTITTTHGTSEVLDTLTLVIRVEIADKEIIPKIRSLIQEYRQKARSQT